MSDNKKNRKYNKFKESKKPFIIAKRQPTDPILKNDQIQPKILLKSNKEKEQQSPSSQISIAVRDRETQSQETSTSQSPNNVNLQIKERELLHPSQSNVEQPITPVPIMKRPILLISSVNYQVNTSAAKLLMKANTDFFVVGVLGVQGVGKSTVMNLLASENFESFKSMHEDSDGIFSVKMKIGKCSSLPRTESIHMFITNDRIILLDCPPVLSNIYKRDATTNELDDIKLIITLLTICHLIIVVQDEYINLNLLRLLQFGELTKPNHDSKPFANDYMPNILFVKNKANRLDFLVEEKLKIEKLLVNFFKNSLLNIFIEKNDKNNKNKKVNYILFPNIKGGVNSVYNENLETLFNEFKNYIFMLPRNPMINGNTELTESLWFDLVTSTVLNKNHFFLTSYEEIKRSQRDCKIDLISEEF